MLLLKLLESQAFIKPPLHGQQSSSGTQLQTDNEKYVKILHKSGQVILGLHVLTTYPRCFPAVQFLVIV